MITPGGSILTLTAPDGSWLAEARHGNGGWDVRDVTGRHTQVADEYAATRELERRERLLLVGAR